VRSGQARLGHYDAKFVSDSCPLANVEMGQGDALLQRIRTELQPGINRLSADGPWRAVHVDRERQRSSLPGRNGENVRRFRGFVQNFLFGTVQGEVENVVVA
jgi:hypothetical protein